MVYLIYSTTTVHKERSPSPGKWNFNAANVHAFPSLPSSANGFCVSYLHFREFLWRIPEHLLLKAGRNGGASKVRRIDKVQRGASRERGGRGWATRYKMIRDSETRVPQRHGRMNHASAYPRDTLWPVSDNRLALFYESRVSPRPLAPLWASELLLWPFLNEIHRSLARANRKDFWQWETYRQFFQISFFVDFYFANVEYLFIFFLSTCEV